MRLLFALVIMILLASCGDSESSKSIEGTHNNEGVAFKVKVFTYDNKTELDKARRDYKDRGQRLSKVKQSGWAGWNEDGSYCEIHVIKATSENDEEFNTWGHELAHCVYGTYHEEV